MKPRNTLTIEQAAEVLGISRTLAYEAARGGSLGGVPALKVGRRLLVPRAALEWVLAGETLPGQEAAGR
jgi:excisionase family DNA binding protein